MIIFWKTTYQKKEIKATNKILKSGWLTTGQSVVNFENKFKKYKQSKFAAAVSSCTDALYVTIIFKSEKR